MAANNISNNYRFVIFLIISGILIINMSCIEPYEGSVDGFEDVLVVNAIITNQLKHQEVRLTRSYRFDEDEPPQETGATVSVVAGNGTVYPFQEIDPGLYSSISPFQAEMSQDYELQIVTESGDEYRSNSMQLPVSSTSIDELYAERITNNEGVEGIAIKINSVDPAGDSKFYRHEFIETFKIIAPYWSPFDAVFVIEGVTQFEIPVILREQEERLCYGTNRSTSIDIVSTTGQNEDRLQDFTVRFIDRDDYILTYRYSVLVRQYVQTPETFAYYDVLQGLVQSSSNVFSEDQPGFLAGNIRSVTNPNENVAGFFEVSAVDEKRIFFNWEDFFPGEDVPPYLLPCVLHKPSTAGSIGQRDLVNIIREERMKFYDFNTSPQPGEGPYIMVVPECGDCTSLGSNVEPDFWIE